MSLFFVVNKRVDEMFRRRFMAVSCAYTLVMGQYAQACCIMGSLSNNVLCKGIVKEGLARGEYRGYDSAGFACLTQDNELVCLRAAGQLKNLVEKLDKDSVDGYVGIG